MSQSRDERAFQQIQAAFHCGNIVLGRRLIDRLSVAQIRNLQAWLRAQADAVLAKEDA